LLACGPSKVRNDGYFQPMPEHEHRARVATRASIPCGRCQEWGDKRLNVFIGVHPRFQFLSFIRAPPIESL
jgi:hypothetical protein